MTKEKEITVTGVKMSDIKAIVTRQQEGVMDSKINGIYREIKEDRKSKQQTLNQILEIVKRLDLTVTGNERQGVEGLVFRVKKNEECIEENQDKIKEIKYWVAGAAAVMTILLPVVYMLIQNFIDRL